MSRQLTFITSHALKAAELSRYLNMPVIHHRLDLPEIQSLDPHEVVRVKAEAAYQQLGSPVLVEDFSLRFEAMGHLPGPLIKWFLEELKPEGLCRLLDGYETRAAVAQDCFALCDENGVKIFDGIMKGVITREIQGEHGYGTEAIFVPEGWSKTWGEMNEQEQVEASLRRIGLKKLEEHLRHIYTP